MIFVDTSYWYALRVARDGRHRTARMLLEAHRDRPLLTTNLVLGELWTVLVRRAAHSVAVRTRRAIAARTGLHIARVDGEDEAAAWTWLEHHDEREYSFVDATSFALMRRLGVTESLAFDGDFIAAGFIELRR